jgi:hypothetical protein
MHFYMTDHTPIRRAVFEALDLEYDTQAVKHFHVLQELGFTRFLPLLYFQLAILLPRDDRRAVRGNERVRTGPRKHQTRF